MSITETRYLLLQYGHTGSDYWSAGARVAAECVAVLISKEVEQNLNVPDLP